jgi:NADPH2:quinone reductase
MPLVFKTIRVFFVGRDDFPSEAKAAAARDLNAALGAWWRGFEIGERFPLSAIAAHAHVEDRRGPGMVVVLL